MKKQNCQFVQNLTSRDDPTPQDPFGLFTSFFIPSGVSGLIPPGSDYGGTVQGCNEDCSPG